MTVGYMLKSQAVSGAYHSAAKRGIPSLLVERGGCGRWSRDKVEAYKKDARAALTALGVLPPSGRASRTLPKEVHIPVYLESELGGRWRREVSAGDMLRKGQLLGTIKNFLGSVLTRILRKV